jgi:hypothetical protein
MLFAYNEQVIYSLNYYAFESEGDALVGTLSFSDNTHKLAFLETLTCHLYLTN